MNLANKNLAELIQRTGQDSLEQFDNNNQYSIIYSICGQCNFDMGGSTVICSTIEYWVYLLTIKGPVAEG